MKLLVLILIFMLLGCMAYPEGQGSTRYKEPVTRYNTTTGELETIYDMGGGMSFDSNLNIYNDMGGGMSFDSKGNLYMDMGNGMSFDTKGNIYIDFD